MNEEKNIADPSADNISQSTGKNSEENSQHTTPHSKQPGTNGSTTSTPRNT